MMSGVSLSMTSKHLTFSRICSGREAPVIMEETLGFLRHQARASWDWVTERESAIGCFVCQFSGIPRCTSVDGEDVELEI